jgi:hypothetical protein
MELYPNPATSQVNVRFFVETSGHAEVQIFDILGNLVAQQGVELFNGANQFSVSVNDLNTGMYQVTVRSGLVNLTKKLVITK